MSDGEPGSFGEDQLEQLWGGLLSRQPEQVQRVFASLTPEEQADVSAHLKRMATETGWHPEQRASALAALAALGLER